MSQTVVPKAPTNENGLLLHSAEDAGRVKLPQLRTSMEVDRTRPLPTSLQADFLPDNILLALTQPPMARDKLGPPSRHRNLATTNALARAPAANVWSHKRREKFRHLLDATSCSCGAGKDISFLYDVPQEHGHPEKPDTIDQSAVRKDAEIPPKKALQLPDTLIPDEYHIVKNRGVMGIEYHEDKYTTNPDDHEKHLVVFPSLKPSSRFEVLQLKKTMEDMLDKVGFNDDEMDVKGPTQMHNLLELIKKEQNIYNIVFHELIRQTSVECTERGQLLAEVRGKYSELLGKVPQQIMSLHEEVMAQRALDRRLTDELMRFKNTIAILTSELSDVKEHDKIVTREAQKTQEDLRHALAEAQKNAALLSEYHDLYELQRRRLEHQVFVLSEEREIWSTAAYSLALKVTEECRLTTAKRLHVSEKAWAKLANHFTILLSDRDTDLLTQIQTHVERWRDAIEDFNIALRQREEEMKEALKTLRGHVERWMLDFQRNCFNKDGHLVKPPDKEKMQELQQDFRAWEKMLSKESEVFGGDLLLSNQEELTQIRKEMEGWTDNALKVFSRHRGTHNATHPDQVAMIQLNDEVEHLLRQYQLRITGENGVAAVVIHMQNVVEMWETRVIAALNDTLPIQDSDWVSFYQALDEWISALDQATFIDIHDVVRKTQKWATTSSNSIDSEDAKLVEQVSTLHSEMVRWMVQTLLRLAPDKEGNSREAADMALLGSASVPQLHENVKQLFDSLHTFSNYVTLAGLYGMGFTILTQWWQEVDPEPLLARLQWNEDRKKMVAALHTSKSITISLDNQDLECCDGIVMENTQKRQDQNEDNPEHEMRDLQRLRTECEDWICTAQILMSQLTGESIEDLFPQRASTTLSKSSHGQHQEQQQQEKPVVSDPVSEAVTPRAEPKESQDTSCTSRETKSDEEGISDESSKSNLPTQPEEEEKVVEQLTPMEVVLGLEERLQKLETIRKQSPPEEHPQFQDRLEVLGGDKNTHQAGLKDKDESDMATTPVKAAGAPDTKRAFEALATVNALQDQLLMTEQRAQEAEERASSAETELATAQELIRTLQKQMSADKEGVDTEASLTDIASISQPPSRPEPSEQSREQSSSAEPGRAESKNKSARSNKSSGKSKKQK